MKKILFITACCSLLVIKAGAQTYQEIPKAEPKVKKVKKAPVAQKQVQQSVVPLKDSSENYAEKMRTPESGMTENGAGKTAPHQVTTKKREDNLNNMDETRD